MFNASYTQKNNIKMDFVDLTHSIKIKFDCFPNKNNTVEMKLGIMEQVYMMLLT